MISFFLVFFNSTQVSQSNWHWQNYIDTQKSSTRDTKWQNCQINWHLTSPNLAPYTFYFIHFWLKPIFNHYLFSLDSSFEIRCKTFHNLSFLFFNSSIIHHVRFFVAKWSDLCSQPCALWFKPWTHYIAGFLNGNTNPLCQRRRFPLCKTQFKSTSSHYASALIEIANIFEAGFSFVLGACDMARADTCT